MLKLLRKNEIEAEEKLFKHVPSVKELIAPDGVYIDRDYIKVGRKYIKSYVITEYPLNVFIGWLEELKLMGNIDISFRLYPADARGVVNELNSRITKYQSQMILDNTRGTISDQGVLGKVVADLVNLRDNIQFNKDRLFYITGVISINADSIDVLEKNSKILEDILAGKSIRARTAFLRQDEAYKVLMPVIENYLEDMSRNFNVGAGISLFPFASPEFSHKKGTPLGINLFTGSPIVFDQFIGPKGNLPNSNLCVFGQAGAGKSFFMKILALRNALRGIKTVFIDPEGEYKKIIEKVGGTYIKIEVGSRTIINPFDIDIEVDDEGIRKIDILKKVNEIKNLIGMIVEGVLHDKLTAVELSLIEDVVIEEYRKKGIDKNPYSIYVENVSEGDAFYIGRKKKEMPTLTSFAKSISVKNGGERIATILKPFLREGTLGIFDGQSNVELGNSLLTCFDISGIGDEFLRTYGLYVTTNWVWNKFANADIDKEKEVIVDEGWMHMKYKDTAKALENLSRRDRKRRTSLVIASQSFIEFSESKEGRAILTNAATTILLRQSPTDIDAVQEIFHLSQGEREFLLSCSIGDALLRAGKNSTAMKVVASDYEKDFIKT